MKMMKQVPFFLFLDWGSGGYRERRDGMEIEFLPVNLQVSNSISTTCAKVLTTHLLMSLHTKLILSPQRESTMSITTIVNKVYSLFFGQRMHIFIGRWERIHVS